MQNFYLVILVDVVRLNLGVDGFFDPASIPM